MTYLSYESLEYFACARRRAFLEQAWQWLMHRPRALLLFDEVRMLLGLTRVRERGLEDVDLTKVIGTVAKQRDFTRGFRPRKAFDRDRWRRVYDLMARQGFDPIDLYQVGEVYFVVDGHHRVSVARAHGLYSLEAHVSEWVTSVKVERETTLERLQARICRERIHAPGVSCSSPDAERANR